MVVMIAARRRRQQETRVRRGRVAGAAPAVFLPAATGHAQLTRGRIGHRSDGGGSLVLVSLGRRVMDGVQWTGTGR